MKRMTIGLAALLLAGCVGCTGKATTFDESQKNFAQTLDGLRQANFKGRVRFNEGGSILGVNAATNWSLGPQQVTLSVEGEVDFTDAPREAEKGGP